MSQGSRFLHVEIPSTPTLTVNSVDERSPAHRWSETDRTVLCLLKTLYNSRSADTAKIFNAAFIDRLDAEGLPHGLSPAAISSQWWEMQHRTPASTTLSTFLTIGLKGVRVSYPEEREIVEDTAAGLKIQLAINIELPTTLNEKSLTGSQRRRKSKRTYLDSEDSSSETGGLETPSKRPRALQQTTDNSGTTNTELSTNSTFVASQTESEPSSQVQIVSKYFGPTNSISLKIRFDAEGNKTRQKPRLLFRAFQPEHGIRARKFLHKDLHEIPAPPAYDSYEFQMAVEPHLNHLGGNDYQSPFLSLTESPRSGLRKLLAMPDQRRSLAIFDFLDVEQETKSRYGDGNGLYLCPAICKKHKFDHLPGGYTGFGEWLTWSSIESEPIGVLDYAEAEKLQLVMSNITRMDYESGHGLGQCLKNIRARSPSAAVYKFFPKDEADGFLQELVAYKLLRNFLGQARPTYPGGSAYNVFMEGLLAASTTERAASVVPEGPASILINMIDDDDGEVGIDDQDDDLGLVHDWDSLNTSFGDQQEDDPTSSPKKLPSQIEEGDDEWDNMADAQLLASCQQAGMEVEIASVDSDPEDLPSLESLLTPPSKEHKPTRRSTQTPSYLTGLQEYAQDNTSTSSLAKKQISSTSAISETSSNPANPPAKERPSTIMPRVIKTSPARASLSNDLLSSSPPPTVQPRSATISKATHPSSTSAVAIKISSSPPAAAPSGCIVGAKEIIDMTHDDSSTRVTLYLPNPKTPVRRAMGATTARTAWSETPDREDEDGFEIIGTGRRERKMLTIRSRSLSTVK